MKDGRQGKATLNRPLYYTLLAASAGLWASGALWLLLHHFARTQGPFGETIHPLEPVMLQLHGFFLIPALMAFGGIMFGHVGAVWRFRKNRGSGFVMLAAFALLAATGYALYYAGGDALRQAASLTHWICGLAAPAALLRHAFLRGARARPARRAASLPAAE